MNCLIIGKGRWGNRIAATLLELGYKVTQRGRDWRGALLGPAFVATPAETHARIVSELFEMRVPVFCEKPFTTNLQDAEKLSDAWVKHGRPVFLVDHVQLFSDTLRVLLRGTPTELDIRARGNGPFRERCSGLWDWGSHAIAEAMYLTNCLKPDLLSFVSSGPLISKEGIADNVSMSVKLNDSVAVLAVSNSYPYKERRGVVQYDNFTLRYNTDHAKPPLPLTYAVKTFLQYISEPDKARSDVRFGMELPLAVVRFLTEVDTALAKKGIPRPQVQGPTL